MSPRAPFTGPKGGPGANPSPGIKMSKRLKNVLWRACGGFEDPAEIRGVSGHQGLKAGQPEYFQLRRDRQIEGYDLLRQEDYLI